MFLQPHVLQRNFIYFFKTAASHNACQWVWRWYCYGTWKQYTRLLLENRRLSDRYRIGTDTGCIVSNRISYCCIGRYYVHYCRFVNCWGNALHTMIKGRLSDPSPARRARTRVCCFMVHDAGEGWRGGMQKETVTWYRHPRDTKTAQYWSWPPSCRTPSTSRKW